MMPAPALAAPKPVHPPNPLKPHGPGTPAGGIAGMLAHLAQMHAAQHPGGPGARQAGAPFNLTQRGNPVSPYGNVPPAPPMPQRPPMPAKPAPGGAF